MIDWRVISIGTMPAHPHWGERRPARTGHATTTLLRGGGRAIIVDPGLPPEALAARLFERAGLRPESVTHVFLTSFHPDARRGISAFDKASWWIHGVEREGVGVPLAHQLRQTADLGDDEPLRRSLELDVAILRRCEPAPDTLIPGAERVDLFPLPGVSPGLCGLLIAGSRFTALVCGDAVPTVEHLERGQVADWAADVARARESFAEAVEIADLLVPGRDNAVLNPTRRPF